MIHASSDNAPPAAAPKGRRLWKRLAACVVGVLLLYLLVAYVVVPAEWIRYAHRHPAMENVPGITRTADGIPGDPLNVALIGTSTEVKAIMAAAKWYAADPLGLRSDLKIAADTVLKRPDDQAPVSSLYLFGAERTWPSSNRWATTRDSDTTSASGARDNPTPTAGPYGSGPRSTMSGLA